jgi:hypothetical protein
MEQDSTFLKTGDIFNLDGHLVERNTCNYNSQDFRLFEKLFKYGKFSSSFPVEMIVQPASLSGEG